MIPEKAKYCIQNCSLSEMRLIIPHSHRKYDNQCVRVGQLATKQPVCAIQCIGENKAILEKEPAIMTVYIV